MYLTHPQSYASPKNLTKFDFVSIFFPSVDTHTHTRVQIIKSVPKIYKHSLISLLFPGFVSCAEKDGKRKTERDVFIEADLLFQ